MPEVIACPDPTCRAPAGIVDGWPGGLPPARSSTSRPAAGGATGSRSQSTRSTCDRHPPRPSRRRCRARRLERRSKPCTDNQSCGTAAITRPATTPGSGCWPVPLSPSGGCGWPGWPPPCWKAGTARTWCCCTARAAGRQGGCRSSPTWSIPTTSSSPTCPALGPRRHPRDHSTPPRCWRGSASSSSRLVWHRRWWLGPRWAAPSRPRSPPPTASGWTSWCWWTPAAWSAGCDPRPGCCWR